MAKKAVKKTEIALVREDLEALQDECNALAARVAYLETFRPAIELIRDEPKRARTWTEWLCGG